MANKELCAGHSGCRRATCLFLLLIGTLFTLSAKGKSVGFYVYPNPVMVTTAKMYVKAENDLGNKCCELLSLTNIPPFLDRVYIICPGWCVGDKDAGGVVCRGKSGGEVHDIRMPYVLLLDQLEEARIQDVIVDATWAGRLTELAKYRNSTVRVISSCKWNEQMLHSSVSLFCHEWQPGDTLPDHIACAKGDIHPQIYTPTCEPLEKTKDFSIDHNQFNGNFYRNGDMFVASNGLVYETIRDERRSWSSDFDNMPAIGKPDTVEVKDFEREIAEEKRMQQEQEKKIEEYRKAGKPFITISGSSNYNNGTGSSCTLHITMTIPEEKVGSGEKLFFSNF